jgi:hypothetical protein
MIILTGCINIFTQKSNGYYHSLGCLLEFWSVVVYLQLKGVCQDVWLCLCMACEGRVTPAVELAGKILFAVD